VADGSLQGGRVGPLDLAIELPSHVALLGDATSGVRTFAGLLGGQAVARTGHLTFGGVDLAEVDAEARTARIAFAGGTTLLLPASLRQNLLYGSAAPDAPGTEERLAAALAVADLSEAVYRRGLAGAVDSRREPDLAGRIVALRPVIRAALDGAGLLPLVQPFDPDRFNPQSTLGENILFGVPLGDTFRDENLPSHPFMRALLDREGLTAPLVALGTAIVRSTLEMFWGLSARSTIVGRFSLLSGPERDEFELILARHSQVRGAAATRDAGRLIGLALRYSEVRHRLGLVQPDMEARILAVRRAFAAELPPALAAAVEFFRPDRVCSATNLLDNLLFGRIALDQADARDAVLAVLNGVVASEGLKADVLRIGLDTRIDPDASGLSSAQAAAIDLVRCLVREPDILVVQRAADELPRPAAVALAGRLRAALAGRGLLMVLPGQADAAAEGFDRVIAFEAGRIRSDTGTGAPHG
jgi:predicted ABC-type transport system involved in lysophospholipase L1 biosynthesis ATPase subunit